MASLFTSLHPFQHNVHVATLGSDRRSFEVQTLPPSVATLPERLREAGYSTFGITDNQNISAVTGFDRGFDRFASTSYESAEAVHRTLLDWREAVLSSEPYFLYVHYMDPHMPYHAREPWYSENRAIARPDGEHAEELARYDSEIRYVDGFVEKLFAAYGWLDGNTVVVVTSDHGEEFGDHGGTQHGRTLYAEVLDVPLFLFGVRPSAQGARVDARVSLTDVAPTLLAVAGAEASGEHVGRPIHLESGGGLEALPVFSELVRVDNPNGKSHRRSEMKAVIRDSHKLVQQEGQPAALFDLQADPGETTDLRGRQPGLTARLTAELRAAEEEAPRYAPGSARLPLSPKQIEKLHALGYAD